MQSITLKKAKENGCTLVLCDVTGARAAKDIGLNYNLVTSGRESIENAVAEAVSLCTLPIMSTSRRICSSRF